MNVQIFTLRVSVFKLLSGKRLQGKGEDSNKISITARRNGALCVLLITGALFCQGCLSPVGEFPAKPVLVDRAALELSPDGKTLKGKGRVLFDQPLFSLHSKELYLLTADFFHSNSSLILYSHFSDFSKQDGVKVFFEREAEDLVLHISTPGHLRQTLGAVPDYFLKNHRLSLYIEVENGTENFVDIQIWDSFINLKRRLKSPAPFLSLQNRKAFSPDMLFHSRGQGILWGLELKEVRLIQALRNPPNNS